jgi:hypothetical protein
MVKIFKIIVSKIPKWKNIIEIYIFREEKRTANIIADDPDGQGVTCLVIDRDSFHHLKDLDDIKNRYVDLPERKKM